MTAGGNRSRAAPRAISPPATAVPPGRLIDAGAIAGAHGVNGWVRVKTDMRPAVALLEIRRWFLSRGAAWAMARVEDGKPHARGLIAKLDCCTDRDAAERLTGAEVAVLRRDLPETQDGEYYWADLIGLRVVTVEGVVLGRVLALAETGANDVLKVAGERERLIPFVLGRVVRCVDLASGEIRVSWDPAD